MTASPHIAEVTPDAKGDLAVMLTGGGARAAYQVGLLKGLATHFPDLRIQIITGASAGAINAIYLAACDGTLMEKARRLEQMWCELNCDSIYQFDWKAFLPFRAALASLLPKKSRFTRSRAHALVDTAPLRSLLCNILETPCGRPIRSIEENIRSGALTALALMTLDYSTGQTVRWVQGRTFDTYAGPNHRTALTEFTVEHVLASAALPFVFPAVRIGNAFHGDGGIRMAAPLSSAVQLGARRIIAMSTGYLRAPEEASDPVVTGYPPAAQILSQLVNAIFLDGIEEDVARMQRMNELLKKMAPQERDGLKPIELLVLRPSIDLGKLSSNYEQFLPRKVKLLVRAMGVKETESPDFISLLMFEPTFTKRIVELGETDVSSRLAEIRAFLGEDAGQLVAAS
ncbi:MAG TPA: patatin-like phospholipase family protein [Thermoanaerobaculia bacterium]|jgi:NTE family protein|nr:patatin-like phospholipase family protein [Thermoanaerobaculia bacterium]